MTTDAPAFAQDPSELFDVVTADGVPTGIAKPRAAVHRDGDWHRSVHIWVAGIGEQGPFLLIQRRGYEKDTWAGYLDATVGGHLRSGERLEEALRETEEEIGIAVELDALRWLGTRPAVSDAEDGIHDRELQSIYLHRDDRPLTAYRPSPYELAALIALPLDPLLALLNGEIASLQAVSITPGAGATATVTITTVDFIPTVDRYFYRVAIAASMVLRGERHVAV